VIRAFFIGYLADRIEVTESPDKGLADRKDGFQMSGKLDNSGKEKEVRGRGKWFVQITGMQA
jgi:hypothetical protein